MMDEVSSMEAALSLGVAIFPWALMAGGWGMLEVAGRGFGWRAL